MTEQLKTALRIADGYGPYAFGVVAFLTIWFLVCKPELDQRLVDYGTHIELIRAQEQIARTLSATADSMALTAEVLEETAHHLAVAKGAAKGAN